MLKIKHKHHLDFPHITFPLGRQMAFDPVSDDDDELVTAIDNDLVQKDNEWELEDRPDTDELEAFWQRVEDDVTHDPEWFKFAKE